MRLPKILVLTGLTVSLLQLKAQDAPTNLVAEAEQEVQVIEVVASPITEYERIGKDGANQVIIGRPQLERLNATDLPTALRQVPGIAISRFNPIGAYGGADGGSFYVRGSGAARPGGEIRTFTDGVPRFSGVWEHPIMDIIPIDFADQITIARNPQPHHYPGTFGAVDVATRRRTTEGHEAELDTAFGRFNTFINAASVGGKMDLFDYYAGLSYKYSDGPRSHSAAQLFSTFARTGWELSEHDHIAYIYNYSDNWTEDPGRKGSPKPQRDQFGTQTHTHALRLDSDHDDWQGYTLVYFDLGKIRWHQDHLSPNAPGYSNTDWRNYGLRSLYDWQIHDLTLTAGLELWSDGGHTGNYPDSSRRRVWGFSKRFITAAPYLGAHYDFEITPEWTLTPAAGTRYYFSEDFDNEWAPHAALTLAREGLQFYGSYARGVHYPGIYMFGTSAATWRQLEAETSDVFEVGTVLQLADKWHLQTGYMHMDVKDRMDNTPPLGYVNSGRLQAHGAESSLHWYPLPELSFFAGGSYLDPRQRPASRMPSCTLSAGVSWQIWEYLRLDLDSQYVSTQYAYNSRTSPNPAALEKLDDFLLFNTRLALDLRAFCKLDGELYIALENFTHQHYEYFPGYEMPGILWYTGMKVRF